MQGFRNHARACNRKIAYRQIRQTCGRYVARKSRIRNAIYAVNRSPTTRNMDPVTIAQTIVHDHSASQATFVEISFAISIGFAVFPKLRDKFRDLLTKRTANLTATVITLEANKPEHAARVAAVVERANKLNRAHERWQENL